MAATGEHAATGPSDGMGPGCQWKSLTSGVSTPKSHFCPAHSMTFELKHVTLPSKVAEHTCLRNSDRHPPSSRPGRSKALQHTHQQGGSTVFQLGHQAHLLAAGPSLSLPGRLLLLPGAVPPAAEAEAPGSTLLLPAFQNLPAGAPPGAQDQPLQVSLSQL